MTGCLEQEDKCPLTVDLVQLIEREANLLCHGFSKKNLEGLRKRISHLFLQYIRTPTYNPEAQRLLKVRYDAYPNCWLVIIIYIRLFVTKTE